MALLEYLCAVVAVLVTYFVVVSRRINNHWKKRGIPGPEPVPFFGNLLPVLMRRKTMSDFYKEMYDNYPNEPLVGYYHFMVPILMIRDKGLVDRVFIKDFQCFTDRFGAPDIVDDPSNANLFVLGGNAWRTIRAKFTPMFTTGKLKAMHPNINAIADRFIDRLSEKLTDPVDLVKEAGVFAIETTSSCAFGIEPGAVDSETNEFGRNCLNVQPQNIFLFLRMSLLFIVPKFSGLIRLNVVSKKMASYFLGMIKDVLQHRRASGTSRQDLVQQMIVLQEKGEIEVEPQEVEEGVDDKSAYMKIEPTDDLIAGQALAFLLAGFDTTKYSLACMLLELAMHPEEQEIAREEVRKMNDLHGVDADSLKSMEYLEACMKEGLRLHSPLNSLVRICTKTCSLNGHTVNPGDKVFISIDGIHLDPSNYGEPEKFKPSRWLDDENRPQSGTYLAWGYGPRTCIGMRFASLILKSALAKILLKYRLSLAEPVKMPLAVNPMAIFFNFPSDKIFLKVEKV
ncbi:unnamed protein product [Nesidiocoris tenuis]|uniref:Uncharacterized protein n=2 Tax=Nesidiocoris tenuis TaxID=355587 RepID=A0A6H5GBL3_9HEMI|nr:cytochrome P450 [Nesidiocoris tenuis]CAA9999719.1 unnamed protein product [Nesidiocoris tenuis]